MPRPLFKLSLLVAVVAVAAACEPPSTRIVERHPLTLENGGGGSFVGVSRDPESGEVVLLHDGQGLFTLDDGGKLRVLATQQELLAEAELAPASAFTDVAALGRGEYALTAVNEGFLFDGEILRLHFCYLPGEVIEEPGPDPVPTGPGDKQLTLSLGYDADRARLLAQPRTFDEETGELLAAHVATFDVETGIEQAWFDVGDREFLAGGLLASADGTVVLGRGASLYRYEIARRELSEVADLSLEIGSISGLASGDDDDTLLVLDGEAGELLEVRLVSPDDAR